MIVKILRQKKYIKQILIIFILWFQLPHKAVVLANTNIEDINDSVVVKTIEIQGYTIFSDTEIEALVAAYQGKRLNFSELRNITKTITEFYISQGYITSGAFLPEQEIVDGTVRVQVVEGKLENIQIEGLKNLAENYVRSFITSAKNIGRSPLNVKDIEDRLNLLRQNTAVEDVRAELVKGTKPNLSILLLELEETAPFEASASLDNYRSPSIGEFQGTFATSYSNIIGYSDRIFASYNFSEGFDAYAIGYQLPIGYKRGTFGLEYRNGDSKIVENFSDVGIRAESNSFSLEYSRSIVERATREVSLGIAFEKKNSRTFILENLPFSFVEGPQEGRSASSVIKLKTNWLERSSKSVLGLNSQVSLGLDLFDATVNDNAPDALFFSWLGQIQWAKALNRSRNLLLVTRLATQLSPDSLLPLEQFTLGGVGTVRGYRQNREIGDNAIVGTIEIYLPLIGDRIASNNLNLVPFFDAGKVWDNDGDESEALASLGIALDWQFKDWLSLKIDWGVPIINTRDFGDSLQDNGVSFSLELQPF